MLTSLYFSQMSPLKFHKQCQQCLRFVKSAMTSHSYWRWFLITFIYCFIRWIKNLISRHCTQVGSEKVIPRWEQDYQLQPIGKLGLFYEYLEMGEILHTIVQSAVSITFRSFMFPSRSDPVWFRHTVRGVVSFGSSPGTLQQSVWNPHRRLENHHSVPPDGSGKSPRHWSVAADPAGGGHSSGGYKCVFKICYFKPDVISSLERGRTYFEEFWLSLYV